MIIISEQITKFTLEAKETNILRIILETFAKQNKDLDIPVTVNFAQRMANDIKKSREEE